MLTTTSVNPLKHVSRMTDSPPS